MEQPDEHDVHLIAVVGRRGSAAPPIVFMPFDPTKPVEGSDLDAAEMRDQLNALKALYDAQAPNHRAAL